ncbi:MAG: hypothetical protein OEV94_02760 [Deltaproteobacteria bacterium]|nr:hypothetical protein [Deltaproteobacteria bacterium]
MARLAPEYKIKDIEDNIMDLDLFPNNPFINKTWKAHILPDSFITTEQLHCIVGADDKTVRSKKIILISAGNYEDKISRINEIPIIQINNNAEYCNISKIITDKDVESIDNYYNNSKFHFTFMAYIFPETKKWGIVTHLPSEVAIIGGEQDFIEAFEESMGGRDLLINDIFEVYNSMRPLPHDYFYTLIKSIYGDDIEIKKDDYNKPK